MRAMHVPRGGASPRLSPLLSPVRRNRDSNSSRRRRALCARVDTIVQGFRRQRGTLGEIPVVPEKKRRERGIFRDR